MRASFFILKTSLHSAGFSARALASNIYWLYYKDTVCYYQEAFCNFDTYLYNNERAAQR